MREEIFREESNVYVGNEFLNETETIVYYSDGSFEILKPEIVLFDECEEEDKLYEEGEEWL